MILPPSEIVDRQHYSAHLSAFTKLVTQLFHNRQNPQTDTANAHLFEHANASPIPFNCITDLLDDHIQPFYRNGRVTYVRLALLFISSGSLLGHSLFRPGPAMCHSRGRI